ncbi:MAG: hypothetical protein KKA07_03800 [Bacteroidetes bacterium]|nr:hypothetical protein [Bacteroidota bacterium]MBU1718178.1 hypothetical protein [Bacteroidota bacterium]
MKNKNLFIGLGAAACVVALVFIINGKGSHDGKIHKVNPAFKEYISAFTSGVISAESTVQIRLTTDVADSSMIGNAVKDRLFSFDPSIEGTAYWVDSRTIEYVPEERLPAGIFYNAEFRLDKVISVPDSLRTFEFQFQTMRQSFDIKVENHKPYNNNDLSREKLMGTMFTADIALNENVEKVLKATQSGRDLPIVWEHDGGRRIHKFRVDSIIRAEEPGEVKLSYNGNPIDVDLSGEIIENIRSINDFAFLSAKAVQLPDQCILLQFSDPIMESQDLNGLISIGTTSNLQFDILDNEIRVFSPTRLNGNVTVTISEGVKNSIGKRLNESIIETVKFEDIKPNVRLVGKGVILPNSEGLVMPFEAVNLKAVDVKIIRIFENNISQFLQVNELTGSYQLARVGRTVLKKKVSLDQAGIADLSSWNRFTLDLAELIKAEPGAIYQVEISFRKAYSLYPCEEEDGEADVEESGWEDNEEDEEWYYENDYYYDDYYYGDYGYDDYEYDGYYYDWRDRDDPCKKSYYNSKKVTRNVLASDLGIIAKVGNSGSLDVFITDLVTTQPIGGVEIELLDYTKQRITKAKTDGDGHVCIPKVERKPFLLIASIGEQKGYMKLQNGQSLSLSKFEVSGERTQRGLKGFIYGERGIWRPGDSLYLTFILEDKEKLLPPNHPVTFDLVNPRGQVTKHFVRNESVNGFYNLSTCTDADAPTGLWTARVSIGGAKFTKYLSIETIKPNRLKILFDFNKTKLVKGKDNTGILSVKWLHGAVAKNLKADVNVTLTRDYGGFEKYPDHNFNDPAANFYSETRTVFSGKLDENGHAEVDPEIEMSYSAPGLLKAHFETRVFEESGNFSIDRFTMPYYPYESFVGVKAPKGDKYSGRLDTDKDHQIEIVNIDADGRLLKSGKVKVKVYKLGWRWWWDNSYDNLADYINSEYHQALQTEVLDLYNGKANFKLRIDKPDWGRFLVRVTDMNSGHSSGLNVYLDWPGFDRKPEEAAEASTMATFELDKEKYDVGDEVKLTIPACPEGRALLTLETGNKVMDSYWIETKDTETEFSFKATAGMAPNIYAYLTIVQPHAQTKNDLPIRMYGVKPVFVEDPNTHLRPVISMPDVIRPEEEVTINVKEENGKPMTFTLAMVDEGLLDLTHFETPEPWTHFYAKEALGVKTWDVFDMVMGAYGAELQRILSIGGGGDGEDEGGAKANRFKPMVKFFGPIAIPKGGNKSITFRMPQYVGSVRVMVVAGQNCAYGSTDKTVQVRKPLMLLGTLPRVVGPEEEVKLPVSVFAMEKHVKNVEITVKTNEMFSIEGETVKKLTFEQIGDELVTFNLKVKPKAGVGKVWIFAKSGNETAKHEIEIDVRNANTRMTDVIEAIVNPGESWSSDYKPLGMEGTNNAVIEVSSIPPIDLERRLKYLVDYPHGCVEQTTSSAFPQLYLADLIDLDDKFKAQIENNIKYGINRLKSFQNSSGGFIYWPGYSYADDWSTSYVGHFLIEAQTKGYSIPNNMIKNWVKYQKKAAGEWKRAKTYYNNDLVQAYRLYTLALAKEPQIAAMNRLREEKGLSVASKWRLAAAYQLAGKGEIAKQIVNNLTTVIPDYREMYYTYGSSDRDKAMIIEALTLMNDKKKAMPLVMELSRSMSSNYWMSTQSTAFALMAISKFSGGTDMTGKPMKFSYTLNSASKEINTRKPMSRIDMELKGSAKPGKLSMKNTSDKLLYVRVITSGIPLAGEETASESNMNIKVTYYNLNAVIISPAVIEQGTDFIAEVTLTNPGIRGYYYQIALTEVFPSGWEIRNTRLDTYSGGLKMSYYEYQDVRDDRVNFYFSIPERKAVTYRVQLNASYLGRFYLPPAYCEAMYDNTINARNKGQWVEVVPPGGTTSGL